MRSEGERVTDWRKEREINGGQREIRVPWRTTTAKSGGFRGGVEWSGLVVGGSQISDIEQEGEQDRCIENELDLGWIGLGWWRSRWRRQWASNGDYMCDLAGVGVRRDRCDLGLGLVLGATRPMLLVRFPYCFSLSLSSIFLGWKSFEGKMKPEMDLHPKCLILQSTQNINSVWPNFQYLPNTHTSVKAFPEILWSQNKRNLRVRLDTTYFCWKLKTENMVAK